MRSHERESDDAHVVKRSKNSSIEAAAAAEFLALAPPYAAAAWSEARSDAALAAAAAAAAAPTAPPLAAPPSKQSLAPGECYITRQPSAMLALVCRCLDARDLLSAYKSSKQMSSAVVHPLTYQHGLSLRVEGMRVAMAGPSAKFSSVPNFESALRSRLFTHFRILTLNGTTKQRSNPVLIALMRVLRKHLQGAGAADIGAAMVRSLSSGSSGGFQLHSLTLNSDRFIMPSAWKRKMQSGDAPAAALDDTKHQPEDALDPQIEAPFPQQFHFDGLGGGGGFQFGGGGGGGGGFHFGAAPVQMQPQPPQQHPFGAIGGFGLQAPPQQIFGFGGVAQAQPPQAQPLPVIGQPPQSVTIDASLEHDSDDELLLAPKPRTASTDAIGVGPAVAAAAAAGMPSSLSFGAPVKPEPAAAAASTSSSSAAAVHPRPKASTVTRAPAAAAPAAAAAKFSSKRKQRTDDDDLDDESIKHHPYGGGAGAASDSEAGASDVEIDAAAMAHADAIAEEALAMIDEEEAEDTGSAAKAKEVGSAAASSSSAAASSSSSAAAAAAAPDSKAKPVIKRLRLWPAADSEPTASASSSSSAASSSSSSAAAAAAAPAAGPRDLFDLASLPCTRFLKVLCLSAPAYALADLMYHLPASLEVLQISQVLSPYVRDASLGPPAALPRDFLGGLIRHPLPKLRSMLVLGADLSSYSNPEQTRRPPEITAEQQGTSLIDLRTLCALTCAPELPSLESVSWMVLLPLCRLLTQWAAARASGEADPQSIPKVRSLLCDSLASMGTPHPSSQVPAGLNGGMLLDLFPDLHALSFTSYVGFAWANKGKDGKPTHVPSPWPSRLTSQLVELCITGKGDPVEEQTPPQEQGIVDCLAGISSGRWSALQRLVLVGNLTRYRQRVHTVQLEDMFACMPNLAHLSIPNLRLAGSNLLCFRSAKKLTHLRGLVWPYQQSDAPAVTALHGSDDTRMSLCFPALQSLSVAQALEPTRYPARALLIAIPTLTSVGWRNESACHPNRIEELWVASRAAADKAKSARDLAEAARAASAVFHTARTHHIARLLDKGLELKDAEANWDGAQSLISRIGSCTPEDESRIRSQHFAVAMQKLMEEKSKRAAVQAGAANQNEIDDKISRGVYTIRGTGKDADARAAAGAPDDSDFDSDDDSDERREQRAWRHSVLNQQHQQPPHLVFTAPNLAGPLWSELSTAEFNTGFRRGVDRHADLLEEGAAARIKLNSGGKMEDAPAAAASSSSSAAAAASSSSTSAGAGASWSLTLFR